MVTDVESIIITLVLIVLCVAYLLRPEWFTVPGANPLSRRFRGRRRARYGNRYK